MPSQDEASLLRLAPSTALDGLDLTVAEAVAMPPELFRRIFGVASLDDVPLVGPGFLEEAPKGCAWYLRWRPAPEEPKKKDRKVGCWELVVPARKQPDGRAVNPLRKVLAAKHPDGARLEALVFLARKAGRRIRASNWPVERVESLRCGDVLKSYEASSLVDRPDGKEDPNRKRRTRHAYMSAIAVFGKHFPEMEIGDAKGDWIPREYELRTGRPATSRYADLKTIKMALNRGLLGLGANYTVKFDNPDPGSPLKLPWTVQEYDAFLRAADGWLHWPGGAPMMIPGPHGLVQARREGLMRGPAWVRIIEFLPYTVTRHNAALWTRWVPPEVDPKDGLPLPRNKRAWIEVTDDGIYYHRGAGVVNRSNKKRDGNRIPAEFEPTVRAFYEADMAAGREWVFHKKNGDRYRREHLSTTYTLRAILRDAGMEHRRKLHHLKDLAVEWADAAKLRREALAVHAATSAKTLAKTYGEAPRTALLDEAAAGHMQRGWRENGASRDALAKRFGPDRPPASADVLGGDFSKGAAKKGAFKRVVSK